MIVKTWKGQTLDVASDARGYCSIYCEELDCDVYVFVAGPDQVFTTPELTCDFNPKSGVVDITTGKPAKSGWDRIQNCEGHPLIPEIKDDKTTTKLPTPKKRKPTK